LSFEQIDAIKRHLEGMQPVQVVQDPSSHRPGADDGRGEPGGQPVEVPQRGVSGV
jgi:hypothetical protein